MKFKKWFSKFCFSKVECPVLSYHVQLNKRCEQRGTVGQNETMPPSPVKKYNLKNIIRENYGSGFIYTVV